MPSTKQPAKDRQKYVDDRAARALKRSDDSYERKVSAEYEAAGATSDRDKWRSTAKKEHAQREFKARRKEAEGRLHVNMGNQGQWSEKRAADSLDRLTKTQKDR